MKVSTIVVITILVIACLLLNMVLFLSPVDRADAAAVIIWLYELRNGKVEAEPSPFTDIYDLSVKGQENIEKMYQLGITAGTSETTYSPNDKLELYQAFLFIGRLLQVSE